MTNELPVLSVGDLTIHLKEVIESNFYGLQVQGELSNVKRHRSGHIYLTLKDDEAQISGVIWRTRAKQIKFDLQDGLDVIAVGSVQVYQPRGEYQLVIDKLVPLGVGALELAFRQLQQKLQSEGLFDPARKRQLPKFPRRIVLITSPSGAALRDILQVMTRRWKAADVLIFPVAVQGENAARHIAAAFEAVKKVPDVDLVITGRGGGSLEDLWAFNEEIVARAIADCSVPVMSAVGHEVDVSIADLVADRRALTPSEAGELAVPSVDEIREGLENISQRMSAALVSQARNIRFELDRYAASRVFTHPDELFFHHSQHVDELSQRMARRMDQLIQNANSDLRTLAASLDALSPLKVLGRGYSISRLAETQQVVTSVSQVHENEILESIVPDGTITSKVVASTRSQSAN